MGRYPLTRRVYNTLIGRGYELVCKICDCPLKIGDCVESKPSKYRRRKKDETWVGGRKMYHCECYDASHIEVEDDEESD